MSSAPVTPAVSSPAVPPSLTPAKVQTAREFLKREFPPKEPLVEGLLYRRDIVAFAGRRRNGKTTFLLSLGTALAAGESEFLGYVIPKARRVVAFFLEDDDREIQDKLAKLTNFSFDENLAVYTREYFFREGILIDVASQPFRKRVEEICGEHGADVVILDNLAYLIGADYNDPKKIHRATSFAWELTNRCNCAVVIPAHPRKRSGKQDLFTPKVSLRNDPEDFFEEVMGSSHFVNSCGSLWGIERNFQTNRTDFLGGTQRLTGEHSIAVVEKAEDGRLKLVTDDAEETRRLVLNTDARRAAWELLPRGRQFSYSEAERAVKSVLKSSSSFNTWFNQLKQLRAVMPDGDSYRIALGTP